jgi:hypothetical protein
MDGSTRLAIIEALMMTPANMTTKTRTPLTIHFCRRVMVKYTCAGVWPLPSS